MKASPPRRLSSFQRLMRGWSELAPYNFIHALRFAERAEPKRWRAATVEALAGLGLETAALTIETPRTEIDSHLEAELNRGFAPGDLPLRFFLLETQGGHWFGVVLDHWFADDFSSRMLLQRIHANYRAVKSPELFWGKATSSGRNWLTEWRSLFQQASALRRARRIPLRQQLDFTVETFRKEMPAAVLETARACAKERGATVHDVFLAAAAQACSLAHPRQLGSRRGGIGLASAMDLRRFETGAAREGLGLLISQYAIVEEEPEKISLPELVARVARKTSELKTTSGWACFVAGVLFWRLAHSRKAKATLYQRGAPFAAGLSNVNLSGSWLEQAGIAEFRRVGPTGPVVPFVFMITTFRGRVFVDATFRRAAMSRPDAQRLLDDFGQRLAQLAG